MSQGAGWWLASDGKWYPPESATHLPAPPPPPAIQPNPWDVAAAARPSAPPKKRHNFLIGISIVIGAIVLISIIASATSGPKGNPPNPNATPGIGQVAKDGDFAFVVKSFTCGQTVLGSGATAAQAPAGTTFCIATIKVTDDKNNAQTFDAADMHALTTKGQDLEDSDAGIAAMPTGQEAAETSLSPGQTMTFQVPYDVETDTHVNFMDLHDSAFSGGVTVKIK